MILRPEHSVFVTGHRGMVGSALMRTLKRAGQREIITAARTEVDLTRQREVEDLMAARRPDVVIVAAARVGGIVANNTRPAEFIYENLMIAANLIHAAHRVGSIRLLFMASSCVYPRAAPQPIAEDCLLAAPLESTHEAYAVAKIAGLKLCQHYRRQFGDLFHSAIPTNLYGPGDNYHPEYSHVVPGLIRRFHEAKVSGAREVVIWGTGTPLRELLHVDDLAEACLHLLRLEDPPDWVNIGSGQEVTIRELAELIKRVVGFEGTLRFDSSKPDGALRRRLDTRRLRELGWQAVTPLAQGLAEAYADFRAREDTIHLRP